MSPMKKETARERAKRLLAERTHIPNNGDRAQWAEAAVDAFRFMCGVGEEDAIADLMGNLGHLAIARGENAIAAFRRGIGHFLTETIDPPDGMGPALEVMIVVREVGDFRHATFYKRLEHVMKGKKLPSKWKP